MLLARTAVVCDEYMMKEMSNLASGELDGPGPLDLESGGSDDACVAALDLRRVEESDKAGVVDLVSYFIFYLFILYFYFFPFLYFYFFNFIFFLMFF